MVDPEKVSYEDVMANFLRHAEMKELRSLKRLPDGSPTLATVPRLDRFFGGLRASDVAVADLKRFRSEAKAEGLSDARANRYMATLRAAFRQAARDELITAAEMPAYFPTVHEPNEARGAVFIEQKWYEPLRKSLRDPLRSAFVLSYWTAVRVHELWRLRWRDVDLKARTVTLPGGITKTKRPRTVFVPGDFSLRPGKPDDLVFPVAGAYRKQWQKACVAAGIGHWEKTANEKYKRYVGPLIRHCRHTAIRNMSDSGLEEKRIMDISGHVTRATFDRYNLGRGSDVAAARETIEKFHQGKQGRKSRR